MAKTLKNTQQIKRKDHQQVLKPKRISIIAYCKSKIIKSGTHFHSPENKCPTCYIDQTLLWGFSTRTICQSNIND